VARRRGVSVTTIRNPGGWFLKIPVTEPGAAAKLKFAEQKYKPKLIRKKRP
jgi:hypothetical protein